MSYPRWYAGHTEVMEQYPTTGWCAGHAEDSGAMSYHWLVCRPEDPGAMSYNWLEYKPR
jgi:hypothetical protein